ncbi:hypothetical protein OS493_015779 [Desmophyllum pertusum]|uniref:Potassium channel domain-containing protein n=1 Tax=Desmophyllum pertusum TaxID=174260 RepID=A0A9W9YFP8_9CNID|nr:hypothetical protein OS493_015779 [Desmophyllum pertusum]
MATSARIALISTVLTLAMTHYTLADGECPDDNTNLLDETGCPTKDISVMMISFPPYVIFEDDDNGEQFARGIHYTFHDIVKSHGYVLIGLIDQYNTKARDLEFHVKNEEFPMSFTRGSYEGFWWAFISMTTVGYGDKTPRSFFGRLFGVLWILLGLIVITMFTATVTSALTHSSSPEFTNALEGQNVAVFNESNAESEAIYLGATPREYKEFKAMHKDLLDEKVEVEGVFMERLRAFYYYRDYVEDGDNDNLRVFATVPTEITYKMALKKITTCNFLRKNFCFRHRLKNPLIDSLIKKYTTPLKAFKPSKDIEGLLSGNSEYSSILLLIVMGVFLDVKSQRAASDVNLLHLNSTLRQLEGLEQNLEKLSTQVQTMKENLTSATDNNLKLAEFSDRIV